MRPPLISFIFSCTALFLALCLTACGFHVRSRSDLPTELKEISVVNTNMRSDLTEQLSANLQQLGVVVIKTPPSAPVTLVIVSDNFSQTSSMLGTAQQLNNVTLNYNVTYLLRNQKGHDITPPVAINSNTSYMQNANQILGDSMMIPSLQQGLIRDMVEKILAHLDAKQTRDALAKNQ